MARQIVVNGEVLLRVKGAQGTALANLSDFGLSEAPTVMTFKFVHKDITMDAAGGVVPVEIQAMMSEVLISTTMIQTDLDILEELMRLAMGGGAQFGQTGRAGTLMGGGVARFQPGYKFVGLNLTSPVLNRPWRFFHTYLMSPMGAWPIGTEKSVIPVTFRAVAYSPDPWNGGNGMLNYPLFDRTPDS